MDGLVTVFGGTGFLGAQVVRALARDGFRVRAAARRRARGYGLPMLGDVGQIEVVAADILDETSLPRALEGAEACVNCVGRLYQAGRQSFTAVHVEGPARLARAAAAAGGRRFIQISAIGATAQSRAAYAASKARGEAAVRAALPNATIIRPSVIFGPADLFFNRFARMAQLSPALPLIGGGHTRMQPVFVADVARGVSRALRDPLAPGRAFEFGGPAQYSFRGLMEIMLGVIGRRRALVPIPFSVASLLGLTGQAAAPIIAPPITADQVELLKSDNVVAPGAPGLADLGLTATALEPVIPTYLFRYRKGGQYARRVYEADPSGVSPT